MTKDQITEAIAEHAKWLCGKGGKRALLRGSNLSDSNLSDSNLSYSDLSYSNLSGSNLSYSDLSGSNLRGSNLSGSDLSGSNLSYSNLRGSNLSYSNLRGAKIYDKTAVGILRRATRSDGYEFFLWYCEEGFFIKAGCRFLDMGTARQHWTTTRAGTPLGDESQDILDFFAAAIAKATGG